MPEPVVCPESPSPIGGTFGEIAELAAVSEDGDVIFHAIDLAGEHDFFSGLFRARASGGTSVVALDGAPLTDGGTLSLSEEGIASASGSAVAFTTLDGIYLSAPVPTATPAFSPSHTPAPGATPTRPPATPTVQALPTPSQTSPPLSTPASTPSLPPPQSTATAPPTPTAPQSAGGRSLSRHSASPLAGVVLWLIGAAVLPRKWRRQAKKERR
jgi:hypothetical protein